MNPFHNSNCYWYQGICPICRIGYLSVDSVLPPSQMCSGCCGIYNVIMNSDFIQIRSEQDPKLYVFFYNLYSTKLELAMCNNERIGYFMELPLTQLIEAMRDNTFGQIILTANFTSTNG